MINKNKFSIKDTKKVLHKVGKRWVVVSAVLLGLAAGGAAVTNANADTTQAAAQPTAAQQVAKSSANHSFGAADPANLGATKAPSSATMKVGAADGLNSLNGLKSEAKNKLASHNLPSNVSGMKSYAKSKASSADVNHLTDLANLARSNGKQGAYTDLINLANNSKDRFNNITVGSDTTTNSDANTLFGMLNHASSDVSAINSGSYSNSTVSKVAHYLSDAQKLANSNVSHAFNASQLNSMIAQAGAKTLPTSVTVSDSSSSINLANYLNLPDSVKTYFKSLTMSASASDTTVSVAPSYTLSLDIPTVINKGINVSSAVSSAVSGIVAPASNSIQGQAASIAHNLDSQITSQLPSVISNLNNDISNAHSHFESLESKVHGNDPQLNGIDSTVNSLNSSSASIGKRLKTEVYGKLNSVNSMILSNATKDFRNSIETRANAAASRITNELDGTGIVSNGSFGPFANSAVSPSAAASYLNSNSNGIDSLLSQLNVPNASGKVSKVINLLSNAGIGLSNFDKKSAYYNALVSTAASLTDNDTNYSSAYSAYKAIASDANNLNSQVTKASSLASYYANINIPKYSDASAYAASQIVSEANSSANSMESTSVSMSNTLSEANADNTNPLENALLSSVIGKLSTASANYNNSLTGQDTSEALDNETINFMSDNASVGTSNVVGTPDETFNAQSLTAPMGYSLASDATDDATITINKGSANVDVVSTNNTPESGGGYIPFIPSFNNGSSVNTYYEPNVESKARYADYVLVTKALQLHTKPNFTKRNGVAVIKPGVVLNVEKTVRARHNFVRYEVRYNNKNYFVTANKHFVAYNRYELAQPSHYRYAKVDTALQLHQSTNFTKKNGVKVVKPGAEFRINRVVKSNKGVTRYEVNYKDSVYFITTNARYVENAYVQKSNFGKRGHKAVRATKPVNEYRHVHFSKRGVVRHFRRGTVLPVRRVFTIGRGEITRLQLTNGRYVSANKDFVKVIK